MIYATPYSGKGRWLEVGRESRGGYKKMALTTLRFHKMITLTSLYQSYFSIQASR